MQSGSHALGAGRITGSLAVCLFQLIAQDDEIALACFYLLLHTIHLRLEHVRAVHALGTSLGTQDRIKQDHRTETTANAVKKGEREYLDVTSARHEVLRPLSALTPRQVRRDV